MLSFDPTDVLKIPVSKTIIHVLTEQGYRTFLNQPEELKLFLDFNKLSEEDLLKKFPQELILQVQHPFSYEKNHEHKELLVPHRTRSLSLLLHQAKKFKIEDRFSKILEIGSGNGRLLLELRKLLPDASLTGVSKTSEEEGYKGRESTAIIATLFQLPLPDANMDFQFKDLDRESLPGPDNSYDLIISQRSIRYIRRKKELIEEIYRKLAPDGVALIDLQLMTILDQDGKTISLSQIFPGFDPSSGFILLRKEENELDLKISPIEEKFHHEDWNVSHPNPSTVGWQSVYRSGHGR